MLKSVDINCDMGEGFGPYSIGQDDEMLDVVTTSNLACGFHAGDFKIMADICAKAKQKGVAVGAHPGYPDLWAFGRRHQEFSQDELRQLLAYQIGAAWAMARSVGHRLTHVKAHGALGHLVADNEMAAQALIETIQKVDDTLILSTMAGVTLERLAESAGVAYVTEIYADRAYLDSGRLVPRTQPGAVIHDADLVAQRVLDMVLKGGVESIEGEFTAIQADSICVHGDTLGAVQMAQGIRQALTAHQIEVRAFVN